MKANGLKFVTLTSKNSTLLKTHSFEVFKLANLLGLYVKVDNSFNPRNIEMYLDSFLILTTKQDLQQSPDYFKFISKTRIRHTVLMVLDQNVDNEIIDQTADKLNQSMMFYLFQPSQTPEVVIKLRNTNKTVHNKLNFVANNTVQEEYDMQGIFIINIALPWLPDFGASNCDQDHRNCKCYEGILPVITNAAAKILNFTWDTQLEPDGDWGILAKSGPNNKSGTFSGVLGGIINDEYPLSLSHWIMTSTRLEMMDYVISAPERAVLMLTPQNPEVDLGLFIRPFQNEAWLASLGILVVVVVMVLVPFWWNSSYDSTESFMVTKTTGWCFFHASECILWRSNDHVFHSSH